MKGFFDSPTFLDHANHPSIGRRVIFWTGLVMVFAFFAALILIAWLAPLERAKTISTFVLGGMGFGATIITASYASAQYSKAKAHEHQPPVPPATSAPTDCATQKTTIATDTSTKADDNKGAA